MQFLSSSLLRLKRPISLQLFIFLFSMWLVVPFNIIFLKKVAQFTPYAGFAQILFLAALVIILFAYFNILFSLFFWRYSAKPLAILILILTGGTAYFTSTLGIGIDAYQIQNAVETDALEVVDLMSWKLVLWFGGFVFIPAILLLQFDFKKQLLGQQFMHKALNIVLSSGIIVGLVFIYYVDLAAMFREHRELKAYLSPQNVLAASHSYYKKLAPKKDLPLLRYGEDAKLDLAWQGSTAKPPKLLVLVVGETARAESFSLNGYSRPTNPELEKMPIINFSQVSSCGTATAVSLPCMFSGMQRQNYDARLASHRENALDILQRAGYKVTWIDNNSGCKGICDRVEKNQISTALKQKWCKDNECYDEILVDALRAYLAAIPAQDTQPRVLVLHQMGSHGPAYYKRTPKEYQRFKPFCATNAIQACSKQELVNVYDNSIVYTDHVLAQLINVLAQRSDFQTAFWYLSDHGESTGEHGLYLHGAPYMFAPTQQTHIPMLMWFSQSWQQAQPQQKDCLAQQKNRQLSQDNLFSTLLSLMDVRSQTQHKELDLLQQCVD